MRVNMIADIRNQNGELTGKVLDVKAFPSITEILRDLTDEEAKIVNSQLESESIETGVKLF